MNYKCATCGTEHEEWPSLTFNSPFHYHELSEEEKELNAELGNDYCIILHENETDRFIRVTLSQKIKDHCEDLDYGLWVSLSEKSYLDYQENFNNPNHLTQYFGWLCSSIPEYGSTLSIPCSVNTRTDNQRPEVIPHNNFDHPFVKDYYEGITKEEAEKRIHDMLENIG
jgi:hypothetical protein